jgi:PAS domain S-box-containing protein
MKPEGNDELSHSGDLSGSVARRLTMAFAVLGIVATLITTAVQTYGNYQAELKLIDQRLNNVQASHGRSLAASVWRFSDIQIEIELQGLLNTPGFEYAEVTAIGGGLWKAGAKSSSDTIVNKIPLTYLSDGREQTVATLTIVAETRTFYERIKLDAFKTLLYFGVWTLFLTVALFLIVRQLVTRHLDTLAGYTSTISFDPGAPTLELARSKSNSGSLDELDQVVNAINSMRTQLADSIRNLSLSQQRFRNFAEASSDWFWEMDESLRFTRITGQHHYSQEWIEKNAVGKTRPETMSEYEDINSEKWQDHLADMKAHRPYQDFEFRMKAKDSGLWVSVSGIPYFSDEGQFLGYRGTGVEITDRKNAEERFRRYFELPLVGSAIYRTDKTWIAVNDALCDLLGYQREELMGLTWPDVTHPDDLEDNLRLFEGALSGDGNAAYSMDKRFITRSGEVLYATISGQCIRKPNGGADYFILLVQDITARKKAEDKIKSVQSALGLAEAIAHVGNWTWNTTTQEVFWSPECYNIFGKSPDTWVPTGDNFRNEMPSDDRQRLEDANIKGLETGEPFDLQYRYHRGGNPDEVIWVHVYCNFVKDNNGDVLEMVGIVQDITDRVQAELKLLEAKTEAEMANESKSHFLANVSHDLRTPLNAIIGFSEVMTDEIYGPVGNDKYEEYVADIHNSGKFLLNLINDLLDLSKAEAGEFQIIEGVMDLKTCIQTSSKLMQFQAREAKVHLSIYVPDDLPSFRGDERVISQVLNNLLSNAVKFTGENGKVSASADISEEGGLEIQIADTGYGMSPEDIDQALKPFVQTESTVSRQQEGTGLGLTLSEHFVELHGGKLIVESELGEGTTVTARFPLERVVRNSAETLQNPDP